MIFIIFIISNIIFQDGYSVGYCPQVQRHKDNERKPKNVMYMTYNSSNETRSEVGGVIASQPMSI